MQYSENTRKNSLFNYLTAQLTATRKQAPLSIAAIAILFPVEEKAVKPRTKLIVRNRMSFYLG
jgi:hypothetical protein